MPDAPNRPAHGQPQVPRQVLRLIEASMHHPPGMQRHRDHRIRVDQNVGSGLPHQSGQRSRQRSTTVVFEGVNDGLQ
jgi:hypothetical protein